MNKFKEKKNIEFYYNVDEAYKALSKCTEEYIFIGNLKTMTFKYPIQMVKMLGFPSDVLENPLEYWKKVILEEDWEIFRSSNEDIVEGRISSHSINFRVKDINNEILGLKCNGNVIKDSEGRPSTFVGVLSLQENKYKIDYITKLFTIEDFSKTFERRTEKDVENLAMLILGIDNFRRANEFYGRETGDIILQKLSQMIQTSLPLNGEVFKLEGDKFGIILENSCKDEIEEFYNKIKYKFSKRDTECNGKIPLTISLGVAIYPKDGVSYSQLYQYANYSLDYSKKNGKNNLTFFSNKIIESKERFLKLSYYLKESVINKNFEGFEVVFQPQISTPSKEVKGAEALLRWKHEEFGNVSPLEFIPILEETGLIFPVGKWVLRRSLEVCKEWLKYKSDIKVSVNISVKQFLDENFTNDLIEILKEVEISPENLVLELTENNTITNIEFLKKIYHNLQKLGIKIALDDFGTGYSSLAVLKELPIDLVKVDRAFVINILQSKFDATFIKFVTEICHTIDLQVCVEGVETKDEYELIEKMGVDSVQGYYFGKPQSKLEFEKNYLN